MKVNNLGHRGSVEKHPTYNCLPHKCTDNILRLNSFNMCEGNGQLLYIIQKYLTTGQAINQ